MTATKPNPPSVVRKEQVFELHGDRRTDEYFWLREKENPEVIRYLEAENTYTEAVLAPVKDLREKLFGELKARIKEDDQSVPYPQGPYLYYSRVESGKQYAIHCRRRRDDAAASEEILLDLNQLAEGQKFLQLHGFEPSPDHRLLAYAIDTDGSERCTLRIRDLATGRDLPDQITEAQGAAEWAEDNRTLLYVRLNENLRPYRVLRHVLGQSEDALVFEEADNKFFVGLSKTMDGRYFVIGCDTHDASEVRTIPVRRPDASPHLICARRPGHEYEVEHHGECYYILTNRDSRNFSLVRAFHDDPHESRWETVLPGSPDVLLESLLPFREHLVVFERSKGVPRIRVREFKSNADHFVAMSEPAYKLSPGQNREFDSRTLRFGYASPITPNSVYDYDLVTRERTLIKRQEIPSGHDPAHYACERLTARSADGTEVPITIWYRRGFPRDASRPLYLLGYGSYGYAYDPGFFSMSYPLVERGFAVAVAHIRGGSDLGREWYESAKFLTKKRTFEDFVACAEHLVREKYTSRAGLVASGGSAGGLLVGAAMNMRPELFRAVVAHVPFVDVVNTMLDETLPLTAMEFNEWGNPKEKDYYFYIKSYSPYDNVERKAYPALLVTAGLNDPRVTYWEPAKWVARLRAMKTDQNPLLLHTNMGAGHGGASGRFDRLKEIALEYAFILQTLGQN